MRLLNNVILFYRTVSYLRGTGVSFGDIEMIVPRVGANV